MKYDRTRIEAMKRKNGVQPFPYLKVFLLIAALVFVLLSVLR